MGWGGCWPGWAKNCQRWGYVGADMAIGFDLHRDEAYALGSMVLPCCGPPLPPPPAMDILGHVRAPSVGGQCLGRGVGGFSRPLSIPAFLSLLCLFGLVPPTPPSPRAIPALQGPKTKKPSTTQQAQSKHQHLLQDPGCPVGPQCGFCIVLAHAAPMSTEKLNLRRASPSPGLSHFQSCTSLGH